MQIKEIKKNIARIVVSIFALVFVATFFPNSTFAATLSLIPNSNKVSVGNIFQTSIVVNTQGKAINNSDGVVQFPTDLLEVVSVSKSSSIFSLWVEEPSFSNRTGTISFDGGVPNPGFVGTNGVVATVTFRAIKAGSASIIFSEGAVRENDGLGTDILSSKSNSIVNINGLQQAQDPDVVSVTSNLPGKPEVVSETHPNQNAWYFSNNASFGWKIPSGVTSIQALLNKSKSSVPNVTYDNSVSQKTLNNLSDGISYFHIRFANSKGYGPTEHYKVQVDSTPPSAFVPVDSIDGYRTLITLDATDTTSGIAYYTYKIDDGAVVKINNSEIVDGKYALPVQLKGEHKLLVTAYDRAQNHTEASLSFVSPAILSPKITLRTDQVKQGDTLTIEGITEYLASDVEITVEGASDKPMVYRKKTANDGSFTIVTDPISKSGTVSVSGQVLVSDKVKGEKSEKIYATVMKLETSEEAARIFKILIVILPVVLLSIIILFIIYLGWHKFFGLRRRINYEVKEILSDVHKSMSMLKEELNKRLDELERLKVDRKLNKKEQEIFSDIEDAIDDIDKFIEEKISKSKNKINEKN